MDYVDNEAYDKGYNEGHEEGYDLAVTEMIRDDLSNCPYYNGTGTCSYGCHDEPQCQTCRPKDGWPTENHPIVIGIRLRLEALVEQLAAANADAEAGWQWAFVRPSGKANAEQFQRDHAAHRARIGEE